MACLNGGERFAWMEIDSLAELIRARYIGWMEPDDFLELIRARSIGWMELESLLGWSWRASVA